MDGLTLRGPVVAEAPPSLPSSVTAQGKGRGRPVDGTSLKRASVFCLLWGGRRVDTYLVEFLCRASIHVLTCVLSLSVFFESCLICMYSPNCLSFHFFFSFLFLSSLPDLSFPSFTYLPAPVLSLCLLILCLYFPRYRTEAYCLIC